jgi:PadR family transcriptional regulator, regulatory protein PadR
LRLLLYQDFTIALIPRGPVANLPLMRRPDRITPVARDILHAILAPQDEYGAWEIASRAHRCSSRLYPELARLEEYGWITSRWDPDSPNEDRCRSRVYRITAEGIARTGAAPGRRRVWVRVVTAIRALVPVAGGAKSGVQEVR